MNTKKATKNIQSTKKTVKTVIITILSAIIATSLIALFFAFPQLSARRELNKIYSALESGSYDFIVLSQIKPYGEGTYEQIASDFELRLEGATEARFKESFLENCKKTKANGYSMQSEGFWDIKVTVVIKDERHVFYIDEEGVYIPDKYRRFNFSTNDSSLLSVAKEIRDASYEK